MGHVEVKVIWGKRTQGQGKAMRQDCQDVSEDKLEADWPGAKWVRGKRVENEVRGLRHWKNFGFILSAMGTITGLWVKHWCGPICFHRIILENDSSCRAINRPRKRWGQKEEWSDTTGQFQATDDGVWTKVMAWWSCKIVCFGYNLKVELETLACEFNMEHAKREGWREKEREIERHQRRVQEFWLRQ